MEGDVDGSDEMVGDNVVGAMVGGRVGFGLEK
jgi:hypothetical protein